MTSEICPAILTKDISDFRKQYGELLPLAHHFSKLHVDFCDGRLVETETLMPADLAGVFVNSPFHLVGHFMTVNPEKYLAEAKNAGFKWVIFQYDSFSDDNEIRRVLSVAYGLGLTPGLSLNPEVPIENVRDFLPVLGIFQLMGIHPGGQGRQFLPETLERIKKLRRMARNVIIIVDGGVRVGIARECMKAGANILVAGSAIVLSEEKEMAIEALELDLENS